MNDSAFNNKSNTAKKGAAKKVAAPKAKSVTSAPAVKTPAPIAPAPAPKPAFQASPIKASPAAKLTTIVAKVDVGFGNSLFLRGTGPGLSWDKGVEMHNAGTDEWIWSTNAATTTFLAKVLINDVIWSGDPDSTIVAGTKTVITATF
jgi:hypothetical protein